MRLAYLLLEGRFSRFLSCLSAEWLPCGTREALSFCRRSKTNKMRNSEMSVMLLIRRIYCSDLSLRAQCIHKPHCLNGPESCYANDKSRSNTCGSEDWPHGESSDGFVALRRLWAFFYAYRDMAAEGRTKQVSINSISLTYVLINVVIACSPRPGKWRAAVFLRISLNEAV